MIDYVMSEIPLNILAFIIGCLCGWLFALPFVFV